MREGEKQRNRGRQRASERERDRVGEMERQTERWRDREKAILCNICGSLCIPVEVTKLKTKIPFSN